MMATQRFLRVAAADRGMFLVAVILLTAVKLGLRLFPFRGLQRVLGMISRSSARMEDSDDAPIAQVVWAIDAASRRAPWIATCLTRALAAQVMLARVGRPTKLAIGVAKGGDGRLLAHAWLQNGKRIVLGGDTDLRDLTPLSLAESRTR